MDRLYSVNKNSDIVGMFLTHPIAYFIDSIYWLTQFIWRALPADAPHCLVAGSTMNPSCK